jgi:NAD(P)-dependent dehydrogenase (short-subunit alcohol dehydrogenase family)
MESFDGRIAVVTGGGTGMGRELVRQLAAGGADVAMCDVQPDAMNETVAAVRTDGATVRLATFVADVSNAAAMDAFAAHVASEFSTSVIHLLFNNAGIGGGGSFVLDSRADWDRTFAICWGGVYNGCRSFMPMLVAADAGHVINTSSVNGFWASLGPSVAHTAYSAAKFAVKGFTEALVTDFRLYAPHLHASVVMPGHIGTSIAINSSRVLGRDPKEMSSEQIADVRDRLALAGLDASGASDEDLRLLLIARAESFRDDAPMSAAQAATVILDGVRTNTWRILVGDDAVQLDQRVRERPADAYELSFYEQLLADRIFGFTQR